MKRRTIYLLILFLIVILIFSLLMLRNKNAERNAILSEIKEKSDIIEVYSPSPFAVITSPLKISGRARGNWFFEATFPVKIVDSDGKTIATSYMTAKDDWMTENFVEFEGIIEFPQSETEKGFIILEKDNPSGLPEYDDSLKIPIQFQD